MKYKSSKEVVVFDLDLKDKDIPCEFPTGRRLSLINLPKTKLKQRSKTKIPSRPNINKH